MSVHLLTHSDGGDALAGSPAATTLLDLGRLLRLTRDWCDDVAEPADRAPRRRRAARITVAPAVTDGLDMAARALRAGAPGVTPLLPAVLACRRALVSTVGAVRREPVLATGAGCRRRRGGGAPDPAETAVVVAVLSAALSRAVDLADAAIGALGHDASPR